MDEKPDWLRSKQDAPQLSGKLESVNNVCVSAFVHVLAPGNGYHTSCYHGLQLCSTEGVDRRSFGAVRLRCRIINASFLSLRSGARMEDWTASHQARIFELVMGGLGAVTVTQAFACGL